MNLFRSEEHIARWVGERQPGATIGVTQLARLGHTWYGGRLDPDWAPRTHDESQAILTGLGLTGPFWQLP
jgi:hypothetical protein